MTTNQTIDGVPRAALEILLSGKGGLAQAAAAHELRALLDAPAPEPIPIGEGTGRLLTAYNAGEFSNEGGSETVESLSVEAYDAEQDQFDADSYMHGYCVAIYAQAQPLLLHLTKHHGEAEDEQPAPVAVDVLITGFHTTESGGGKYAINIGFRSMADMQAADAQLRELLKSR